MGGYILSVNAATSTGLRDKNQDVFFADGFLSSSEIIENQYYSNEFFEDGKLHVFAVCDGVGMYANSGAAAEAALLAIKEKQSIINAYADNFDIDTVRKWAEDALIAARDALFEYCDKNQTTGSATIVLLAIVNEFYVMVNTGDSPAFVVKNEEISEISVRHNMSTLKKMLGAIPVEEEARILLHHLGEEELIFEEKYGKMSQNVIFFICSDGVSNVFDVMGLFKRLKEKKDASFFVSFASKIPEADNCSSIIISLNKQSD